MTPKVKSFEKCLSGFCDWTPNYVSWPNLVKIGRCEVAERTAGIWIRPTTQKSLAPRDSSQPPFCPKWADRAQISLNVVTPWHVHIIPNLVRISITSFSFARWTEVVCGDCNENQHFFSVRWYISANIIPARSRDYRFINPESRDWEKGSGIGISTLRLVKRRLAPRPSRIPDREFAGNGAVSIPSWEF